MLVRVRKEETKKFEANKTDGLLVCLDYWVTYMHLNDADLGVKGSRILECDRDGYDDEKLDPDVTERKQINEYGAATQACISSLPTHLLYAIYKSQGIATAWRFPNLDYFAVIVEAQKKLIEKLKENIATRHFF